MGQDQATIPPRRRDTDSRTNEYSMTALLLARPAARLVGEPNNHHPQRGDSSPAHRLVPESEVRTGAETSGLRSEQDGDNPALP